MNIYFWKNKKLYKSAVKCDDQQQYTTIIESTMVSTPEVLAENSPMSPDPSVYEKTQAQ